MNKIKQWIKTIKVFFDSREIGYSTDGKSFPKLPSATFLLSAGILVFLALVGGSHFWGSQKFMYFWLFGLTMWAVLHVRKSVTTWEMFDEIDSRSTDFAEEVDKRFYKLHKDMEEIKTSSVTKKTSQKMSNKTSKKVVKKATIKK